MLKRSFITIVGGLVIASLASCDGYPWPQGSSLSLVDASQSRAVLEYAKNWSGYEILPSSIWLSDLPAGDSSRFKAARVQSDLQASGDYYVAERPTDNGKGSRVVAGQFSTGDEWTLLQRNVSLTGRFFREVVLDGDRAVYRSPAGLTVYSVSTRTVLATIPLTEPATELLAVGGNYGLIALDQNYSRHALVNLDDGGVFEPPATPDGYTAQYTDAALSDSALITSAFTPESAGPVKTAILILDLPARTWRVLADYGPSPGGQIIGRVLQVLGANDQIVLVSVTEQVSRSLELIDRASGQRTAVTSDLPVDPGCAILRDGKIYWIDSTHSAIRTLDTATRQSTTYPVNLPGRD